VSAARLRSYQPIVGINSATRLGAKTTATSVRGDYRRCKGVNGSWISARYVGRRTKNVLVFE
jgi:hypothetical protein